MPTVASVIPASRFADLWSPAALRTLREQLEREGYLQLTELTDDFRHAEFAGRFGTLMPQYDGELIWEIAPRAEFETVYHSLNQLELFPHTECYEFPGTPPRYLCLWCVRPDADGRAMTFLADTLPFLAGLQPDELALLQSTEFSFQASAGIRAQGLGIEARHPLVEETQTGRPIVRMSLNNLYNVDGRHAGLYLQRTRMALDTPVRKLLARFEVYFKASHHQVRWSRNDFLIWDNQRITHARPEFRDPTRLLKRVWLSDQPSKSIAAT